MEMDNWLTNLMQRGERVHDSRPDWTKGGAFNWGQTLCLGKEIVNLACQADFEVTLRYLERVQVGVFTSHVKKSEMQGQDLNGRWFENCQYKKQSNVPPETGEVIWGRCRKRKERLRRSRGSQTFKEWTEGKKSNKGGWECTIQKERKELEENLKIVGSSVKFHR